MQGWFNTYKSINMINHRNRMNKNRMTISKDIVKVFEKFQHLNKRGTEGTYLKIIKAIYDKPIANIKQNQEKLKTFPLRTETRQR